MVICFDGITERLGSIWRYECRSPLFCAGLARHFCFDGIVEYFVVNYVLIALLNVRNIQETNLGI